MLPCNHPSGEKCEDQTVSEELEAAAKCLYQTSINARSPDSWKWLTPHIRNRWRWRFIIALEQHNKVLKEQLS